MSDQIAEIRARHETDDRWRLTTSMICPGAHDDRAALLAEVERLRAENARIHARVTEYFCEPDTHPVEDA